MKIKKNGKESFRPFSNIWVRKGGLSKEQIENNEEIIFSSYSDILTVDTLYKYLEAQKAGVLEKLKRLILASGEDKASEENKLLKISTIQAVRKHMFDHGHLGWYPFSCPYVNKRNRVQENSKSNPRGIFNINDTILQNINIYMKKYIEAHPKFIIFGDNFPQGYEVNPSLRDVVDDIITKLFSYNISTPVLVCNPSDKKGYNGLIKIDVTYVGAQITGLTSGALIGLQTDNTPTNRVRIQVGVKNGRISISSIYPLD